MAYPINSNNNPNGGDCPNSHPVRIPGLFYEHLYSVDQFPHGDTTRQPFLWSNGDPTGYGLHGDFVSGWVCNFYLLVAACLFFLFADPRGYGSSH